MEEFDKKWKQRIDAMEEEGPSESSVRSMMDRLDEELPIQNKKPEGKIRFIGIPLRVAASLALLTVFGYLIYMVNEVGVTVGKRAQVEVSLPDGSNVMINADSRLAYNKLMWYFERNVSLEGEAFFDVKKGEKFSVVSKMGTTEVLGTSFNVLARPKHLRVKCHTGRVRVRGVRSSTVLNPGEGITVRAKEDNGFTFDVDKELDWRSGEFYFDSIPFEEVIEELERQFAVQIDYPDELIDTEYTGYFNNRNFDQAMRFVCDPFGLVQDSVGNKITLEFETD